MTPNGHDTFQGCLGADPSIKLSRHFALREAVCRCGGKRCGAGGWLPWSVRDTAYRLETLRLRAGGDPIRVLSWFRCLNHPLEASKPDDALHPHATGQAVDIEAAEDERKSELAKHARASGFMSVETYRWGVHVDWCRDCPTRRRVAREYPSLIGILGGSKRRTEQSDDPFKIA